MQFVREADVHEMQGMPHRNLTDLAKLSVGLACKYLENSPENDGCSDAVCGCGVLKPFIVALPYGDVVLEWQPSSSRANTSSR